MTGPETDLKKSSVLLVRPGGLGDLLVSLPSIALVREKLPEARLTLACRTDYGRLITEAGLVDDLVSVDSRRLSWLFDASGAAEMDASSGSDDARQEPFSTIVGWMRKSGILEIPHSPTGMGIRAVVAPDSAPDEPWSRYFLRRTLDLFGDTRPVESLLPRLGRLHLSRRTIDEGLAAFGFVGVEGEALIVHTGSGSRRKRWPPERFLGIMRRLSGQGRRGVCVTGDAEEGEAADLDDRAMPPGWVRVRRPDVVSLAGLLSGAGLFLGNDSGAAHLAGACGCPAVVLFRDEFAPLWRPYGETRLVSAPAMEDIATERVWAELRASSEKVR